MVNEITQKYAKDKGKNVRRLTFLLKYLAVNVAWENHFQQGQLLIGCVILVSVSAVPYKQNKQLILATSS